MHHNNENERGLMIHSLQRPAIGAKRHGFMDLNENVGVALDG